MKNSEEFETYRVFDDFVQGTTFGFISVVEILDGDELLKGGTGEFGLFEKLGLSTHGVRYGRYGGNGGGRSVHI